LAFHSSGKKTATELADLVKAQGFELGSSIPDWSREAARTMEETFASEKLREVIDRSNAFLATLGPEPNCLEDELRRIAAALASDRKLLDSTKVVSVNRVPLPPLSRMGLHRFNEFESGDYDGITYLDTFFVKYTGAGNEVLHFHELIHVVQWRLLGPERFLKLYADGLERFGYHNSPLEKMAYVAQDRFTHSKEAFDAYAVVVQELRKISAL
jgi:hypothetical protein